MSSLSGNSESFVMNVSFKNRILLETFTICIIIPSHYFIRNVSLQHAHFCHFAVHPKTPKIPICCVKTRGLDALNMGFPVF
jgi:hypothetical protein